MAEKQNVQDTKQTLLKKAGGVVENVKEKAEELIDKAKKSELTEKAKEKIGDIKEGAQNLGGKVTEKFQGKK